MLSRQVSWLAGPSCRPAFPKLALQWLKWTMARRLQLRGQRRHRTGFPLSFERNCLSKNHDEVTYRQHRGRVNSRELMGLRPQTLTSLGMTLPKKLERPSCGR
ncbi:hypothetical protein FBZ93_116160 [Bradyrhizobium macuxiense]|uniref:Uncharacterized protein n=1 Tax=Bradyrhizobium macuxiense TaxID=1755647 RepID=A0A560L248_9BRAD|nr:hypothetical protein FBZ93_116160 [Bradyrhizobium macuxiense]